MNEKAMKISIQFSTTYLCENHYVYYKHGLKRVKFGVATWELNIHKLTLKKQEQMSSEICNDFKLFHNN